MYFYGYIWYYKHGIIHNISGVLLQKKEKKILSEGQRQYM